MKLILIWWHTLLADMEEDELTLRTMDGSASDVWAARVRIFINWRRSHIEELRRERAEFSGRMALMWGAIVSNKRSAR